MKDHSASVPLLEEDEDDVIKPAEPASSPRPWSYARVLLTLIATVLVSLILVAVCVRYAFHGDRASENALRFTSEGTFQLSIFEDLHFGESINDPSLTAFSHTC